MMLRHQVCSMSLQNSCWYSLLSYNYQRGGAFQVENYWILYALNQLPSPQEMVYVTLNIILYHSFLVSSFRYCCCFWTKTWDEIYERKRGQDGGVQKQGGWMKCLWAKALCCLVERTSPLPCPSSACFPWRMLGDQEPVISLSRLEMDLQFPESTWT